MIVSACGAGKRTEVKQQSLALRDVSDVYVGKQTLGFTREVSSSAFSFAFAVCILLPCAFMLAEVVSWAAGCLALAVALLCQCRFASLRLWTRVLAPCPQAGLLLASLRLRPRRRRSAASRW